MSRRPALAVTEWLGSNDGTVFEGHILTVPGQVFSFDHTVLDDHIPGMPEGILRVKIAVRKDRVRNILERVFAFERYIVKFQMI